CPLPPIEHAPLEARSLSSAGLIRGLGTPQRIRVGSAVRWWPDPARDRRALKQFRRSNWPASERTIAPSHQRSAYGTMSKVFSRNGLLWIGQVLLGLFFILASGAPKLLLAADSL